jgi:hypothetical protein
MGKSGSATYRTEEPRDFYVANVIARFSEQHTSVVPQVRRQMLATLMHRE